MAAFRRRATRRPNRKMVRKNRRYSKKRNYNSKSTGVFKGEGLPLELYVKFPYFKDSSVGAGDRYVVLGNALCPVTTQLQGALSITGQVLYTPGDVVVPGQAEYGQFYGLSNITGSSHKMQFTNTGNNPCTFAVCVLPYQGSFQSAPNTAIGARINALDAFSFGSLCAQPYAKHYTLGIPSSGASTKTFTIYRKTKNMLRVSNIKDRTILSTENIPYTDIGLTQAPEEGWFIYIRTQDQPMEITHEATIYSMLTQRAELELEEIPEPPAQES